MIRTEDIAQGRVDGFITHAERPRAGVLILPTITGVDAHMKERAQALAQAGFSSMIWNPYPGETPPADPASAQPRAAKLNDGAVDAMADCVSHLLGAMGLPAAAVLGFCLGGRYAVLLAARDRRLFACVPFYPSIRVPMSPNQSLDALALAADIRCPVHLVHGTADQVFLPPVYARLRDILEQRSAATMVQVHPGAVHSFMRPDLHKTPANALASRLSWPPVLAFLETSLNLHRAGAGAAAVPA
jgi:carboxymethylenebutenolidase